tara:strand:+ start:184 stop:684 length:501 start_codon:yes stop_codon:yes gene_type:complete
MRFSETRIANGLVKDIERIYDKAKRNPINFMDRGTATVGGKQTDNALFLRDFRDLIPPINVIKGFIEREVGTELAWQWVHFVEYDKGGRQELHNHQECEEISFILYLNDCRGGMTAFTYADKITHWKEVLPKRGRMVFFSSDINHYALPALSKKKVMVGGLKRPKL